LSAKKKPAARPPRPLARGDLARALTFRLTVEYEGTRYKGWQEQAGARTVAGTLRAAAEQAAGPVLDLGGAGRTDAGVHALGQVAHLRLSPRADGREHEPRELLAAINAVLPGDVSVLALERADARFHARHAAESRAYLVQLARRRSALLRDFAWQVPRVLDLEAMARALELVRGRHDFTAFAQASGEPKGSVCAFTRAELAESGDLVLLRFEADRFLTRMVRRLTGALVRVGTDELDPEDVDQLLHSGESARGRVADWTAPAACLFLERVRYAGDPPLGPLVPPLLLAGAKSG
jgi:tRNA pseudouridine38-40 synthase